VAFFSLRVDGGLLGVAALNPLAGRHSEIKSLHSARAVRRQGVGRALVAHLVGVARERGFVG
jgi:putative acetyltransferase